MAKKCNSDVIVITNVKDCAAFLEKLGGIARERVGTTLLSKETGIPRGHFHNLLSERGNPTLESLAKIAEALGYVIRLEKKV